MQSQTGDQEDGSGGATGGGGSVNKPGTEDKSGKVDEKAAKALGKMEKQRQRRLARQRQVRGCKKIVRIVINASCLVFAFMYRRLYFCNDLK